MNKKLLLPIVPVLLLLATAFLQVRERQLDESYFVDRIGVFDGVTAVEYFRYEGTRFLTIHTQGGPIVLEDFDQSIFSDLGSTTLRRMGDIEIVCGDRPGARTFGVFDLSNYIESTLPSLKIQGLHDLILMFPDIYQSLNADLALGKDLTGADMPSNMTCRAERRQNL